MPSHPQVREAMSKSTSRIPACRGVDLLWRDLEVTLGKGVMSKKILKGVSGQVRRRQRRGKASRSAQQQQERGGGAGWWSRV